MPSRREDPKKDLKQDKKMGGEPLEPQVSSFKVKKRVQKKKAEPNHKVSGSEKSGHLLLSHQIAAPSTFKYAPHPAPNPRAQAQSESAGSLRPQTSSFGTSIEAPPNIYPDHWPTKTALKIESPPSGPIRSEIVTEDMNIQAPPAMSQNMGEDLAVTLCNFNKNQGLARFLLNLVYECQRHYSNIPWQDVASRLEPGLTGHALREQIPNLRLALLRAGYVVPPLDYDDDLNVDADARGYFRDPTWGMEIPTQKVTFVQQDPVPSVRLAMPDDLFLEQTRAGLAQLTQPAQFPELAQLHGASHLAQRFDPSIPVQSANFPLLKSQSHLPAFGNDQYGATSQALKKMTFDTSMAALEDAFGQQLVMPLDSPSVPPGGPMPGMPYYFPQQLEATPMQPPLPLHQPQPSLMWSQGLQDPESPSRVFDTNPMVPDPAPTTIPAACTAYFGPALAPEREIVGPVELTDSADASPHWLFGGMINDQEE